MKLVLLALFAIFCGSAGLAQTVSVRAGEHATFTRIVLPLPDGVEWELGRFSRGYGIRFSTELDLQTDDFFRIIPKSRVASVLVSEDQKDLGFEVVCDCTAEAFLTGTGWLVVDIVDGPPDALAEYEEVLPNFGNASSGSALQTANEQSRPQARQVVQSDEIEPALQLPVIIEQDNPMPSAEISNVDVDFSQDERIAELNSSVAESIARAISQGLLDAADELEIPEQATQLSEFETFMNDVRQITRPGIQARTSLDEGLGTIANVLSGNENEMQCPSDMFFDTSSWATGESFSLELADHRKILTGEIDDLNPRNVEDLARFYLFHGFGREAIAVMSLDGVTSQDRIILSEIARLLDGDQQKTDVLQGLIKCGGPAALWGFLGQLSGTHSEEINTSEIMANFRELPFHLQNHLGPLLASNFAISLTQDQGSVRDVIEDLEARIKNDGRTNPVTLIELIDLKLAENLEITQENMELLDFAIFENVEPDVNAGLKFAKLRVLIHSNRFLPAFALLSELNGSAASNRIGQLKHEISQKVIATPSNATFLDTVFQIDPDRFSPETIPQLASRLSDLGFSQRASDFISFLEQSHSEKTEAMGVESSSEFQSSSLPINSIALSALSTANDEIEQELGDITAQTAQLSSPVGSLEAVQDIIENSQELRGSIGEIMSSSSLP